MTNESKYRDETVTHRHSGEAEFWALVEELDIDLGAMVDPRTELSFAMARRKCSKCISKEKCRQALRLGVVTLSEVAPFCPSVDLFVDLLRRQPWPHREAVAKAYDVSGENQECSGRDYQPLLR
jgi:hypothetical protein